jgi:hypothetical protein
MEQKCIYRPSTSPSTGRGDTPVRSQRNSPKCWKFQL